MCRWCTHTPLGSGAPGQRPSSQRCADTFHVPTRSDPQLAGSPVGANRPAETALCLESRARISLGARFPSEICRIRRFRSARTAGQYQDGLRRSDATDRSPLHSGACESVCVCVYVRVCACVCVCVRACLTDENRALRDLITHKPPCDLETCPDGVIPLARRGARSQSRHPTTRQSGCVGPYLARRTPFMHSCKRVSNVGSGLGLSWEARRGAAAGLVGRCQIWTTGAGLPGAERGNCMP